MCKWCKNKGGINLLGHTPIMQQYLQLGRKVYMVCNNCKSFVQVNKFMLGSLHICI